jgi:putative ABC transport system ATP-binding protein
MNGSNGAGAPQPHAVQIAHLDHFFGEGEFRNQVLFNINIDIAPGQLVVVTGPSGSGKTTLLTLMGALRSVQSGDVRVLDRSFAGLGQHDLVAARRQIGFIFQQHNLFRSLTALENVKMALPLGGCPPAEMDGRAAGILERVGLAERMDHKPRHLSGGQCQRVAVARALVNRPKVILADEPTAALDKESSRIVVNLLKELTTEEGCTVVMVTHDNRILDLANRIVNMVDGEIQSDVVLAEAVRICEFLRPLELFRHLTPTELTHIAEGMDKRRYEPGRDIIREGETGDRFFLISDGEVDVWRGAERTSVARLGPGAFFGERALITDEPRNATVTTVGGVEVYTLGKDAFRAALEASATFREQLQRIYFSRQ